jgi:hypothetical protein
MSGLNEFCYTINQHLLGVCPLTVLLRLWLVSEYLCELQNDILKVAPDAPLSDQLGNLRFFVLSFGDGGNVINGEVMNPARPDMFFDYTSNVPELTAEISALVKEQDPEWLYITAIYHCLFRKGEDNVVGKALSVGIIIQNKTLNKSYRFVRNLKNDRFEFWDQAWELVSDDVGGFNHVFLGAA